MTKNFVVLTKGISKSNHSGAHGIFNPLTLFSFLCLSFVGRVPSLRLKAGALMLSPTAVTAAARAAGGLTDAPTQVHMYIFV